MGKYVLDEKDALDVVEKYFRERPKYVSVDTETTGLYWDVHEAFLIQVGWGEDNNFAFPVKYVNYVAKILNDESSEKIFHNAKFDLHFLKNLGIEVKGKLHDTQILARLLLSGNESLGLDDLASKLIDPKAKEAANALKKWMNKERNRRSRLLTQALRESGFTRKEYDFWKQNNVPLPQVVQAIEREIELEVTYEDVPIEIMEKYATGDVKHTHALFHKFYPMVERNQLVKVYEKDMRITSYVFNWERTGMAVDLPYLKAGIEYGDRKLSELREEINELAGRELNTNSPKQVLEIFNDRGVPITKTNEDVLEEIAKDDLLASKILEYRKHSKIVGTYFKPIYERAKNAGGRIHANFKIAGPVTGRFASNDPNLQNIPNYDLGEKLNVRRAFVPTEGYIFVFMDYSQMEVRIMAEYSQDKNLIQAIVNNEDLHTKTALAIDPRAKEIYNPNLPKDEQTDEFKTIRDYAKRTTFGIFYGIGAKTLAKNLGVDVLTARQYINNFFNLYPGIKRFMDSVQYTAMRRPGRYVVNKFGRVYWGEEGREYKLANYLIQGTGADMIKTAIDRCEKLLKNYKSRIVLMVHDELIFEIAKDELFLIPKLQKLMTDFPQFNIPFEVGVEYSDTSWADIKLWKDNYIQQTA